MKGELSVMSRSLFLVLLTFALWTAISVPSWAKNNSNDSLKTTVDISETATINNNTLAPGQYTVIAEGNQARFEQDGKLVAEVPCTWKTLSSKPPYSAVMTNHDRITEVDFSGKTQAIEFPSNNSSGN
jgi:hypothetical protein